MISLTELIKRFKRRPSDLVGIDIGSMGISAVRMRKNNGEVSVLAADVLSPIEMPDGSSESPEEVPPLVLPPRLKGRYACLAVAGEKAVIKFMSFPGHFDESAEAKVVQNIGLEDPSEYRIGYRLISEGHGKSESRVLAVAVPEIEAQTAVMLLPTGLPAPFSLEMSGLATMTCFMHGAGSQHEHESVGVIDFGDRISTFVLFNKGILALIRRFNVGTDTLLDKVQETLGVDRETAEGIISDGAFDVSQSVAEVMEPLVKQLAVSRDFVERHENCHVVKVYVSGGLAASRNSLDELASSLGIEVDLWNPFEGLTIMPGALPENLAGKEWRFSAAIGACLATFEEI